MFASEFNRLNAEIDRLNAEIAAIVHARIDALDTARNEIEALKGDKNALIDVLSATQADVQRLTQEKIDAKN